MFLVNQVGQITEVDSFYDFPNGNYVFVLKDQAEAFAETLIDKKIAVQQRSIDRLKEKKGNNNV